MKYEIQNYSANTLCLDEKSKHLYMESSGIKSLRFPEMDDVHEISAMQNASLYISEDGKRLGLFNTESRLEIYNIQDGKGELAFQKEWKNAVVTCRFCCTDGRKLFVPIQNVLYCFDLQSPDDNHIIYGSEEPCKERWHDIGHISSLSYYNGEIVLMHDTFGKNYLVRISAEDYSIVDKLEVSPDFGTRFSYVTYDQKGGLCLSGRMGAPVLHYKAFPKDISDPDNAIQLSNKALAYLGISFSADGKYVTFQALVGGSKFSEAWLVRTEDWSIVQTITDRRITYAPCFSSKGKYWLIPDKNPLIIDLEYLFN